MIHLGVVSLGYLVIAFEDNFGRILKLLLDIVEYSLPRLVLKLCGLGERFGSVTRAFDAVAPFNKFAESIPVRRVA